MTWSESISCWKDFSLQGGVSTQPSQASNACSLGAEVSTVTQRRRVGAEKVGKGPSLSSGGVRFSMHVSRQNGRHQPTTAATLRYGVKDGFWAGADEVEGGSCSSDRTTCR